jgi:hypothetical protein
MQLSLLDLGALGHCRVDIGNRHRRVHGADVHQRLALLAVQVSQTGHRLSAVEFEDESKVLVECLLGQRLALRFAESHSLPILTLVLAQVEHLKGSAILLIEQSLPGQVVRPSGHVDADPPHSLPLRSHQR